MFYVVLCTLSDTLTKKGSEVGGQKGKNDHLKRTMKNDNSPCSNLFLLSREIDLWFF